MSRLTYLFIIWGMTRDYTEEIANWEDTEIDSLLTINYIAAKSWIVLFLQHHCRIQKNIYQENETFNVINISYKYILMAAWNNIWDGEVEAIEVVVTGALSADNIKGPFLNPLNVLVEIFVWSHDEIPANSIQG